MKTLGRASTVRQNSFFTGKKPNYRAMPPGASRTAGVRQVAGRSHCRGVAADTRANSKAGRDGRGVDGRAIRQEQGGASRPLSRLSERLS